MSDRTKGAELLASFISDRGLKNADAARAVRVSDVTVHHWIRGTIRPRAEKRDALEVWTGGAVPATAWSKEEERALVDDVEPCAEEPTGPVATAEEHAA